MGLTENTTVVLRSGVGGVKSEILYYVVCEQPLLDFYLVYAIYREKLTCFGVRYFQ